jgi:hypothetical protein
VHVRRGCFVTETVFSFFRLRRHHDNSKNIDHVQYIHLSTTDSGGFSKDSAGLVIKMGMVNFSLHSPRTSWTRLDVYPFIILQGLNLIAIVVTCFSHSGSDVLEKDLPPWWLPCRPPLICSAAIPILLLLQALVHLGTYWSVEFKARVTMNRVSDISSAKYVKVQPRKVTEKPGICALETISLSDETGFASEVLILSTRLSIEPPFRGKTLVQRL